MRTSFVLIALLFCAVPLAAQSDEAVPKVEIFGGYNLLHHVAPDVPGVDIPESHGWIASVTGNVNRYLGMEFEVSGAYASIGYLNVSTYNVGGGPRISARTDKATPFVHALFGVSHGSADVDLGDGSLDVLSQNGFAMAIGGGIDWNIHPRFAIRAPQIDYTPVRARGEFSHGLRVSGGLVFKLQ